MSNKYSIWDVQPGSEYRAPSRVWYSDSGETTTNNSYVTMMVKINENMNWHFVNNWCAQSLRLTRAVSNYQYSPLGAIHTRYWYPLNLMEKLNAYNINKNPKFATNLEKCEYKDTRFSAHFPASPLSKQCANQHPHHSVLILVYFSLVKCVGVCQTRDCLTSAPLNPTCVFYRVSLLLQLILQVTLQWGWIENARMSMRAWVLFAF